MLAPVLTLMLLILIITNGAGTVRGNHMPHVARDDAADVRIECDGNGSLARLGLLPRTSSVRQLPAVQGDDSEKAMELSDLEAIIQHRDAEPFGIMEVLHDVQESCGYLPEEILRQVSASLNVPLIEVFRLANFYKAFSLTPRGRHLLTVCAGTACHVRGAPKLLDEVTAQLAVQPGETTADFAFTLETVNCLGACALSPVIVLDGAYHDNMNPAKLRTLLDEVRIADRSAARDTDAGSIEVVANA
jgi:NADH:ubiquinone oxidoreductase subunit E